MAETSASNPGPSLGIESQANIIPSIHRKLQKSRHRASVACTACRDRRTRCVVPAGESECSQCKSSGYECVINFDDERRKPSSKAHLQTLTDRIAILEGLLREKGEELPPAPDLPAATIKPRLAQVPPAVAQIPENSHDVATTIHEPSPEFIEHESEASDQGRTPPKILLAQGKESMVKRLLSTRGHLSFDELSGRVRYFGPTTNCHIYSELNLSDEADNQLLEQARRAEKIIRTLTPQTHDYLMNLYWDHYNIVLEVIHQAAFYEDMEKAHKQFYSPFLHVCILAMGFRFADKSRPDMIKIALPGRESTLHREAKYMLDCELERPGGVPSIGALLLLGDLECGVGRDTLGWLYAGMANRLCFDIGLHLDNRNSGLPEREIEIGRMTLRACVVYDRYWALFLGRPTSLKTADLEIYNLAHQFERLGAAHEESPPKTLEFQIYEALLDLMELAGKITEITDSTSKSSTTIDHNAYLRMAAVDRDISSWYSRLPKQLQWLPENLDTAPFSFFLLHQQYHCTLILLHRPFALYEEAKADSDSDDNEPQNHLSTISRTLCTKHAVRVARIFWRHRQRFNTKQIFVTGLQHAGTAAIALVAALAFIKDKRSRAANMQYLECLAAALQDMTETYQPAERMFRVLEAVMVELREDGPAPIGHSQSVIPARRGSSNDQEKPDQHLSFKKRQTARPRPTRTASQNMQTLPTFHTEPRTMSFAGMPTPLATAIPTPRPSSSVEDTTRSSMDEFVVVSPRTESSNVNSIWPSLTSDESTLDYTMSSYSNQMSLPATQLLNPSRSAWMGAETPNISRPPTAAEPMRTRMPSLPRSISERMDEDAFGVDMNSIDFVPLLNSDDWLSSHGVGAGDLNGFPPQSFASTSPVKATTKPTRSQSSTEAAYGGTMGGLNELWHEMLKSSRSG